MEEGGIIETIITNLHMDITEVELEIGGLGIIKNMDQVQEVDMVDHLGDTTNLVTLLQDQCMEHHLECHHLITNSIDQNGDLRIGMIDKIMIGVKKEMIDLLHLHHRHIRSCFVLQLIVK